MNIYICIAIVCLLGMCAYSSKDVGTSDRVMEYQLDEDQYAVVVAIDGISTFQAKKLARLRAAEIVVQRGDRYFTVDAERETEVVKVEDGSGPTPRNLYQELIIEGDFTREPPSFPITNVYTAIRLVFTSYKQKPLRDAVDACSLVKCKAFAF